MMNVMTLGLAISVLCIPAMYDAAFLDGEISGYTPTTAPEDNIDDAVVMSTICGPSAFDQRDYCECDDGYGFNRVSSQHSNSYEDRTWSWSCVEVSDSTVDCYWTSYVNDYDKVLDFECPLEYMLAGVDSVHDNSYEDRRFKFRCCKPSTNQPQGSCTWTAGYINNFDGAMDYTAPDGWVFCGMYSYHDNSYEDRQWKVCIKQYT